MASNSRLLIEIDGEAVPDADLEAFAEVAVEEAVDEADAATLTASMAAAPDGEWPSVLDPLVTPRTPVAVQVSHGETVYRFDGLSTEAGWEIDAQGASRLTVKAVDRSLDLDLEEKVVAWPGTSESAVAEAIFSSHGMLARVESTPSGPDPDVHVLIQRGTDWAFLRSLAAKWGYATFLESEAGRTTGHFRPLDPLADPQGELALGFGGTALRVRAEARLVNGQRVQAQRIPPLSDTAQTGDAAGNDQVQGRSSLGAQATVLLAPDDVTGELEPLTAATGLARGSAFGLRLSVELDTTGAGILVRARRTVLVKGLGSTLSGLYLVERVRHVLGVDRHVQHLTLSRNALGLRGDEPFGAVAGLGGLP